MLVKTNKQNKEGRDIYLNALTGKEEILPRVGGKYHRWLPSYVFYNIFKRNARVILKTKK